MSIAKLLEAQKVDKERLELLLSLEKGKIKVERDKAQAQIDGSKELLLKLDAEAQNLQDYYKKIAKNLTDTLALVEQANKAHHEDIAEYDGYHTDLCKLEGQLADTERKIAEKATAFKATTLSVMKAKEFIKKTDPLYEEQKQKIAGQVKTLEQKFAEKCQGIDEKLLTKYKAIRKSKSGDAKDVVVPLTDNRCYGCYMEVPRATISKMDVGGWAVCEECGRIIYKNENN